MLLVAGNGSKPCQMIEAYQLATVGAVARPYARFTHAALYVGNGQLVDATLELGIAHHSVWIYCQDRELTVRRLPSRSLSASDIARIGSAAQKHVGRSYSLAEAMRSALMPDTAPDIEHLYCSTFVGLVLAQATGVVLWEHREHRPLHPAKLAAHPQLAIVPVAWCRPVRQSVG